MGQAWAVNPEIRKLILARADIFRLRFAMPSAWQTALLKNKPSENAKMSTLRCAAFDMTNMNKTDLCHVDRRRAARRCGNISATSQGVLNPAKPARFP
jgi:hypothetical protein